MVNYFLREILFSAQFVCVKSTEVPPVTTATRKSAILSRGENIRGGKRLTFRLVFGEKCFSKKLSSSDVNFRKDKNTTEKKRKPCVLLGNCKTKERKKPLEKNTSPSF